MKVGDKISVEWKDIFGLNEWMSSEDADKKIKENTAIRYYTYGIFYSKNKEFLYLASTVSYKENGEIDQLNDISGIPNGCVMKIKVL